MQVVLYYKKYNACHQMGNQAIGRRWFEVLNWTSIFGCKISKYFSNPKIGSKILYDPWMSYYM